jgi:PAS domain S-box-containing protein
LDSRSAPGPWDVPGLREHGRVQVVQQIVAQGVSSEVLDALTDLAAKITGAAFAQVSLLAEEQIIAASSGRDLTIAQRMGPLEDSLCTLTVASADVLIVPEASTHPWVKNLPPVTAGLVGSYLGVPLALSDGTVIGALCAFDSRPRSWADSDVELITAVSKIVTSQLEGSLAAAQAQASSAQFELAVAAAEIGGFHWDLATDAMTWDQRLRDLFGYDDATFVPHIDSFRRRVHPEDVDRLQAAMNVAFEQVGDFQVEYRVVRPDATVRWVEARGRVLPDLLGRPARVVGAAYDSTALRQSRDELARLLETMTDAFMHLDPSWRFTYINTRAEQLISRSRGELLGKKVWESFPEAAGTAFQQQFERAVDSREPVNFEEFYPPTQGWLEVRAWPDPDGLSIYFHDITDRKTAESRLRLLATASIQMAQSLEPTEILRTLARLVVPALGRWIVVALRGDIAGPLLGEPAGDPSQLRTVHVTHQDPARVAGLRALVSAFPLAVDIPADGEFADGPVTEWLPGVPDDDLAGLATAGSDLPTLRALAGSAALVVPLSSRGRTLGTMTVAALAGPTFDDELLIDIARRTASALDNALLYNTERRSAQTLQASLLPRDSADLGNVAVATRYLPAVEGAMAGGDFYQAVAVGSKVLLALGDVMGHGMRSAARMGQLRAIVATLGLTGQRPAQLLQFLAGQTDKLLDLELATLLVALYDPEQRTLTYASAGHPPPLLATPDAAPQYLALDPGPPLGVGAGEFPELTVAIPPGSSLVMYSDGLVENRGESLTDGLERLRLALVEIRLPPELVADHILAVLGRDKARDDDVALLVLAHEADL